MFSWGPFKKKIIFKEDTSLFYLAAEWSPGLVTLIRDRDNISDTLIKDFHTSFLFPYGQYHLKPGAPHPHQVMQT